MGTITELLGHWRHGDSEALSRLMVLLNDHLHEMACIQFARERANHTIQPTALINEVYLRLCDGVQINWTDRSHFFAVSASLMRRVLVDHAASGLGPLIRESAFHLLLPKRSFHKFTN